MVTAIGVAGVEGEDEALVVEAAVEEALVGGALELLLEAGAAEELEVRFHGGGGERRLRVHGSLPAGDPRRGRGCVNVAGERVS